MDFIADYGLFLAKTTTLVIAFLVVVAALVAAGQKQKRGEKGNIEVHHLNQDLEDITLALKRTVLDPDDFKKEIKEWKKKQKSVKKTKKKEAGSHVQKDPDPDSALEKSGEEEGGSLEKKPVRVFVLDFEGDIRASQVVSLREEVTAVLSVANEHDAVLLRLESPGGLVHGYGLAASQLKRITDRNISLTVAVDKVAASGGYMMACVAHKIIAAPFALLGSIGVVAQIPNFHRFLKKHDVDVEVLTAGEYKRTLTIFGENTEKNREKFLEDMEDIHKLFKQFVSENRSTVDIEKVATGEAWYGTRALEIGLVDELKTSDEMLMEMCAEAKVFHVRYVVNRNKLDRMVDRFFSILHKPMDGVMPFQEQMSENSHLARGSVITRELMN